MPATSAVEQRSLQVISGEAIPDGRTIQVYSWIPDRASRWESHCHPEHEILSCDTGLLGAEIADEVWLLPPGAGLFVPAGVPHAVWASADAEFLCAYFGTSTRRWSRPTVLQVGVLAGALLRYLADETLDHATRERAEHVALDVLRAAPGSALHVPMPRDPRARLIAETMLANPSDRRGLDAWGYAVGASVRTLTRIFTAETGMSFSRWCSAARMQAATVALAGGAPVNVVARRVGYRSTSAFIAHFRMVTGQTPGAFVDQLGR